MKNFVIMSDSACDLTKELRERFGVEDYIRGYVHYPDGHSEQADLDWSNINPKDFFEIMADKKSFISTSQASLVEITESFEKYISAGNDVLYVALSSGISGTYNTACIAAKELLEKYPNNRVVCVDSLRYSTALSLLCVYAHQLREEGKTIDETAAWIEENKYRIHQMGTVEDLFYCKKMGRVSNVAAFMGTLVGVKPLADFNNGGLTNVIGKTKGKKGVYDCTIEYMKRTITEPENQIIFIAHTQRLEEAMELKKRVEKAFHPKEVIINTVGQTCSPSIGPGLYAAFYLGKRISDDLAEEKKIIEEIVS